MKKFASVMLAAMLSFCFASGCGSSSEGIEGKWVKTRVECSDGTVEKGKGIGTEEVYEISGDTGTYTCGEKNWDITVEENEDGTYTMKLKGKVAIAEKAVLKGNKLSYSVTVGDETTTFIFERK